MSEQTKPESNPQESSNKIQPGSPLANPELKDEDMEGISGGTKKPVFADEQ